MKRLTTVSVARARLNKLAELGGLRFADQEQISWLRLDVAAVALLERGEVRCPNCSGTGEVGRLYRDCDVCGGAGETTFGPEMVAEFDAALLREVLAA